MFPAQQDTVCMEMSTLLTLYFKMTLLENNSWSTRTGQLLLIQAETQKLQQVVQSISVVTCGEKDMDLFHFFFQNL